MSKQNTEFAASRPTSASASGKVVLWIALVLVLISLAASSVWILPYINQQAAGKADEKSSAPVELPTGVACLGHIEPEDGTIRLGARSLSGQPSIVSELRVREGDVVRTGQVI